MWIFWRPVAMALPRHFSSASMRIRATAPEIVALTLTWQCHRPWIHRYWFVVATLEEPEVVDTADSGRLQSRYLFCYRSRPGWIIPGQSRATRDLTGAKPRLTVMPAMACSHLPPCPSGPFHRTSTNKQRNYHIT